MPFIAFRRGFVLALVLGATGVALAANFTRGDEAAVRFGVHEIVLRGDDAGTDNPFDVAASVTFTPPSGDTGTRTVDAFYDGDGHWRARVFVSEAGEWTWQSHATAAPALDSRQGTFRANDSRLPGRLRIHPRNPRQWATEDGRWFLNLSDTAYYLLSARDGRGQPVSDEDFRAYVEADVGRGITSVRAWLTVDPGDVGPTEPARIMDWNAVFADGDHTRLRLDLYRETDRRLVWLLDHHPALFVQLILLPGANPWRVDSPFWSKLTPAQQERVLRHLVARYAAFPQIFWLITNDVHFAPDRLDGRNADVAGAQAGEAFPLNLAFAREVGRYFQRHDPWHHPISAGHARTVPWAFGDEDWATYLHLEGLHDLGATMGAEHARFDKPVFLGEDRYERDRPGKAPVDMRYFQRRLFWSWLLTGGSANYGGYWWTVLPYDQTDRRSAVVVSNGRSHEYRGALTGLDSVRVIHDYFATRSLELADFEPAPELVRDADGAGGIRAPKLMRRGKTEFLVYHPNAAADGQEARVDAARTAGVVLDLRAAGGTFSVEWLRALDGVRASGPDIAGGGEVALRAPWTGVDVVLRVRCVACGDGPVYCSRLGRWTARSHTAGAIVLLRAGDRGAGDLFANNP